MHIKDIYEKIKMSHDRDESPKARTVYEPEYPENAPAANMDWPTKP